MRAKSTDRCGDSSLGDFLVFVVQDGARHKADEIAEQTNGRNVSQPEVGRN